MISPRPKRISLSGELHLVMGARAAPVPLVSRESAEPARAAIRLVLERLRLLERGVRSQVDPAVDPALLFCLENQALVVASESAFDEKGEGDVVLPSWSDEQTGRRAREELARTERARKWEHIRRKNQAKNGRKQSQRDAKRAKVPAP